MEQIGQTVSADLVRQALAQTSWAGRLELIAENPKIYLDGAHNVPAMERLIEFIEMQDQPVTLLFSALQRKDFQEMLDLLEEILPGIQLVLTSFSYDGALKEEQRQGLTYVADYEGFIQEFQEQDQGILIVTGSLYFISEVRKKYLN